MRNTKLQLDCLLSLGFIAVENKEMEDAKGFYSKAYKCAKQLQEPEIAQQCMCNVGKYHPLILIGICIGNSKVESMKIPMSNIKFTTTFKKEDPAEVSDTESEAIDALNVSESERPQSERDFDNL